MNAPRRTQAERRAATVEKLVDATIESLSIKGYARTSISEICKRAGVSQGALFRQFDTRLALIAHATDIIGRRHLNTFATAMADGEFADAPGATMVRLVRELSRSSVHAAWHEVMVAARTDQGLHASVASVLEAFEAAILDGVRYALPVREGRELQMAAVVLSIMHMFDSEAVTIVVKPNPELEAARVDWAVGLLERELRDAE